MKIPFNKPFLTGKETEYIKKAVQSGKISGNGEYTKKCHDFFSDRYGFKKCLLTNSCTDALEMTAILANIGVGDEVIMPSYTFVSTANAFVLRGAKIRFVDSREDHPGMDEDKIEEAINNKTKAIVAVHYAGVACNMEKIMNIAEKHDLLVIEDAAQAVDSYFTFSDGSRKPLGAIGHLGCFSFHETKNIISGEGGMLVINDDQFIDRSEIIWEKGTNRAAFFRGEIDKYGWVDVGSSFLPSELTAAFLWAQLENLDQIQNKRIKVWQNYYKELYNLLNEPINIQLPSIPDYSTNNGHIFYLICKNESERTRLINYLKEKGVMAVFHYQSLHKSSFYKAKYEGPDLINSDKYTDRLVRLPLYHDLDSKELSKIIENVNRYYKTEYA